MANIFKKKGTRRGRSRGSSPESTNGVVGERKKRFGRGRRARSADDEPRRKRKKAKSRSKSRGPRQIGKNVSAKLRKVAPKKALHLPTALNPMSLIEATTKMFHGGPTALKKSKAARPSTAVAPEPSTMNTTETFQPPGNTSWETEHEGNYSAADPYETSSFAYDESEGYDPSSVSFLAKTSFFSRMCDKVFDFVDIDGNGTVDEKELYAGVLLLHLKLGSYVGAAGCKPLDRGQCQLMFEKFDHDRSGDLDRREFQKIMALLFSNVLVRVLMQWFVTILIVPLVARSFLEHFSWDGQRFLEYITKPRSAVGIELTLNDVIDWDITDSTSPLRSFIAKILGFIMIGPETFWNSLPLTFTSVVLGIIIAPWILYRIDDIFQAVMFWSDVKREGGKHRR